MECMNILGIELNNFRIVTDCLLVLAQLSIAIGSIIECTHVIWSSKLDLVGIIYDCCFKLLKFTVDESSV